MIRRLSGSAIMGEITAGKRFQNKEQIEDENFDFHMNVVVSY